ncbi:MAG TPA: cupredoxin domain-containing protein [Nitrospiraceae bacterium]|nr:cupredoxin domain-containing protein [Nitrospiraceae bacterium]
MRKQLTRSSEIVKSFGEAVKKLPVDLPMNGRISIVGLVFAAILACDGSMQTVSITAEDFRFTPDLVRVRASAPLALSVYNAGREVHEFDSPLLMYATKTSMPNEIPESASTPGMAIRPGQSLRVVMAPPAGTYLYICRRKGHANMTGTLIVE